jgi:ParB-like chromosome segregation protein Spo0J
MIPLLARRIVAKELSVRDTEALVKRENVEPMPELPEIDGGVQSRVWVKDLERRTRETLGRKVKITQNDKKKSIELFYDDNEDMEELLMLLCGREFFRDEQ